MSHVHRTLELPQGYQHFSWYKRGRNPNNVYLNDEKALRKHLENHQNAELRLYTQHQIFYEDDVLKHTRSSPNWEGGFVTYSTCKHQMRTWRVNWQGVWIAGLCPAHCQDNTLLFVGRVDEQFASNWHLGQRIQRRPNWKAKLAMTNPRGDIYTPKRAGIINPWVHQNFVPPLNHTRSVEFYKKSAGSISERPDGKIVKWWRDIEYVTPAGVRPPCFILEPCFLFSCPMLWTSFDPKRAALKLTCAQFLASLK